MKESFLSLGSTLVALLIFNKYIRLIIRGPARIKLIGFILLILTIACLLQKFKYFFKHFEQIWPYPTISILVIYILSINFFLDSKVSFIIGYSNETINIIFAILTIVFLTIFIAQLPNDVGTQQ